MEVTIQQGNLSKFILHVRLRHVQSRYSIWTTNSNTKCGTLQANQNTAPFIRYAIRLHVVYQCLSATLRKIDAICVRTTIYITLFYHIEYVGVSLISYLDSLIAALFFSNIWNIRSCCFVMPPSGISTWFLDRFSQNAC